MAQKARGIHGPDPEALPVEQKIHPLGTGHPKVSVLKSRARRRG